MFSTRAKNVFVLLFYKNFKFQKVKFLDISAFHSKVVEIQIFFRKHKMNFGKFLNTVNLPMYNIGVVELEK